LSQLVLLLHSRRWPMYAASLMLNYALLYACLSAKKVARQHHWRVAQLPADKKLAIRMNTA
jgi:hypothetical protein